MRGNWSELAPVQKSPRCHVNTHYSTAIFLPPQEENRSFHRFFQILTWTSLGKSVDTPENSTLRVKLPTVKVIC